MSAPPANAFIGKTTRPSDSELEQALGCAKPIWDELIADLASEHDVPISQWSSYSVKAGWALRLKRGKRTIVWLSPYVGFFEVLFIFGDRALAATGQTRLPARVLRMLDAAPRYPEGTGLRLQIKASKDIPLVKRLAALKLQN
jgi:hypothetical protein